MQMVSNNKFHSKLLQTMGRPSSYWTPVRKCVAPIVLEMQPEVKISHMISTEILAFFASKQKVEFPEKEK